MKLFRVFILNVRAVFVLYVSVSMPIYTYSCLSLNPHPNTTSAVLWAHIVHSLTRGLFSTLWSLTTVPNFP